MKILLYILVFALLFSSFFTFFYGRTLVDYREIPIYISVGDHLGFNTNNSALYFGTLQKGSYAFRSFVVKNEKCEDCIVELRVDPFLVRWVYFDQETFRLKKGESQEITAYAFVPDDAAFGNYEGRLYVLLVNDKRKAYK